MTAGSARMKHTAVGISVDVETLPSSDYAIRAAKADRLNGYAGRTAKDIADDMARIIKRMEYEKRI